MPLKVMQSDLSGLTLGENRVLNKLKAIYGTKDYDAFLYPQPLILSYNPDFILIDPFKGVCIVEVKDWSLSYIQSINQISVIDANGEELHNPAYRARQYFNAIKNLLEREEFLLNEKKELRFRLYSKVIFTKMNSLEISSLKEVLCQPVTECISSDQLASLSVNTLFTDDTIFLDRGTVSTIRGKIFPELQIKRVQTEIWQFNRVNTQDNRVIATLDYEQEQFARRIPYGHYMITGVPGSGKTVILVARAIHLLRENPEWKIRILTYNKSLEKKLEQHFNSKREDLHYMGIKYENIDISTFHQMAREIAAVNITGSEDGQFWDVTLPYIAMDKAQPIYDAVLIDEYQDFHNSWIKLCLKVCKKHEDKNGVISENIFLAGDRLQSIYNPKSHSWKSLGITIIGRSKLLKTSYRSGGSHIDLAMNYLMLHDELRKEVENFYEGRDGICQNFDSENSVTFFTGNYRKINNVLLDLLDNNYNPEDILVLGPSHAGNENLYENLDDSIKHVAKVSKRFDENKLLITTYHSSKGLENKVCILLNVDRLENKRLVYVGLTRASEKLYIHSYKSEGGEVFNQLLSCSCPTDDELIPDYSPVFPSLQINH
ncbi:nuclease-related domain-containing DEAD/DEAH box helicase [Methanolobus psychrotolerans]|uniref:nuclease-related domain-containing DEAD/DEAH box helicase n=1 Tax=Methanolobus psychrotolerans TaxID=1874706 RepID=UPI000B91C8AB|nr:UvrD-helicase domain-containing protein [Methanolobus psychrotolerans]